MSSAERPPHLVIVGPTATGKSALALTLARGRRAPGVELVSADSMQVYRHMDIGTAKPSPAERAAVPHHLIDVVDPSEDFAVGEYQRLAKAALAGIEARGHCAIVVGGTGLYVQSLVDDWTIPGRYPDAVAAIEGEPDTGALHRRLAELDPLAATRMEATNRRRIVRALEVTIGSGRPFSSFGPGLDAYPANPRFRLVGLALARDELDARIARRYCEQLEAGFLAEVRALADRPAGLSRTAGQALGYRELLAHVRGELTLPDAVALAVRRTNQFARRQARWFRRDPRITWVDARNPLAGAADLLGDWS
jgi:tRNA dimethylallyltransferase